jgi:hypothetical protein
MGYNATTVRIAHVEGESGTAPLQFVRWDYPADERSIAGYYSKVGTSWLEMKYDKPAPHAIFKETARTPQHVELFDTGRTLWIRLKAKEALFSNDRKRWNALCKGKPAADGGQLLTLAPQK